MSENKPMIRLTAEESARAQAVFNEKIAPTMEEIVKLCEANKIAFVFTCRFDTDLQINNALKAYNLEASAVPPPEMVAAQICIDSSSPVEAMMRMAQSFTGKIEVVNIDDLPPEEQAILRKQAGMPADEDQPKATIQ